MSCENIRLQKEVDNVKETVAVLKKMGIDVKHGYFSSWSVESQVKRLESFLPQGVESAIEKLLSELAAVQSNIKQARIMAERQRAAAAAQEKPDEKSLDVSPVPADGAASS